MRVGSEHLDMFFSGTSSWHIGSYKVISQFGLTVRVSFSGVEAACESFPQLSPRKGGYKGAYRAPSGGYLRISACSREDGGRGTKQNGFFNERVSVMFHVEN
jgi:hypothetical protein